jgi:hypothetical protein
LIFDSFTDLKQTKSRFGVMVGDEAGSKYRRITDQKVAYSQALGGICLSMYGARNSRKNKKCSYEAVISNILIEG